MRDGLGANFKVFGIWSVATFISIIYSSLHIWLIVTRLAGAKAPLLLLPTFLFNWKLKRSGFKVVPAEGAEYWVTRIWNCGNVAYTQPPTHSPTHTKPPPFSPFWVCDSYIPFNPFPVFHLTGFIYDIATPPCVLSPFVTPLSSNHPPASYVPNE